MNTEFEIRIAEGETVIIQFEEIHCHVLGLTEEDHRNV